MFVFIFIFAPQRVKHHQTSPPRQDTPEEHTCNCTLTTDSSHPALRKGAQRSSTSATRDASAVASSSGDG